MKKLPQPPNPAVIQTSGTAIQNLCKNQAKPTRRNDMGKIISCCNQKGGTGKTTTCASLGIGLAREGKKVLLVDADPQGDLTTSLGWRNHDDIDVTLATLFECVIDDKAMDIHKAILRHEEGVDLIPANIELSVMEMRLVTAMSREYTLKRVLSGVRSEYDYVLIDCMPSLGMITINALAASDSVIIPVQAQYLPAKGMTQLIKTVSKVQAQLNPALQIDGVLLTISDNRTNLARDIAKQIRDSYGQRMKIYDSVIPVAVSAAETSAVGKSIFEHDKSGKVAGAYAGFVKEVIDDGKRDFFRPAPSR